VVGIVRMVIGSSVYVWVAMFVGVYWWFLRKCEVIQIVIFSLGFILAVVLLISCIGFLLVDLNACRAQMTFIYWLTE